MVSDKGAKATPWRKNRGCDKLCCDNWVIHVQKAEFRLLPHIIEKNELEMDHRPKYKIKTIKLLEENTGKNFVTLSKAKSSQIHHQKQEL